MKCASKVMTICLSMSALLVLAACGGGNSGGNQQEPPPDTTAPAVNPVSTSSGTTVDRIVTLSVTANDNRGVTEVRFFVDGTLLGSDATGPYSIEWDTSGATDGDHVVLAEARDAAGNVGRSTEITVTVRNSLQFSTILSAAEENAVVESTGTAQADLTINLATGAVSGSLVVSGISATAAHIHNGYAGTNGPVLVPFEQDGADPSLFAVTAGATLDAAGIERLLSGALYVNVHTAAHPGGELRGQILPDGFLLQFAGLSGFEAVPMVSSTAQGRAAMTLDQNSGALVVQVRTEGLDDATQAHVHDAYAGDAGPVLVPLQQDAGDATHWFVEGATLNAAGLEAFAAGRLYVNIHSTTNPGGEIRGQIVPDNLELIFTELSGQQEVPRNDSVAAGIAALTLDPTASLLTVHVNTRRITDATNAHLHGAYAGVNGGVQFGLVQDGSDPSHWFADGQLLSSAQLDAVLSGATYVNVHSPSHPGGEIRGQVIPEGILFAFGMLEGSQVLPAVATDAGGTFAVTVNPATMTLVAHANTTGVDDATAAHLHNAYAGTSGGVSIGLTQDSGDVARWSAVNYVLDAARLAAFEAGRFYINVHTPAYPGGEIRGQVVPAPIEVIFTSMSGDQEVPAVSSAASAVAASTVNRTTGLITVHVRSAGADDASASHVHSAYAGQAGGVAIGLAQDPADTGHWSVVEGQLDTNELADYLAGGLYVNLHTPANPGGEIRGQIVPRNIQVVFSSMDGSQVVPAVVTAASGIAATTVNLERRWLVAFVNASGADDATSAELRIGTAAENGSVLLALTQTLGLTSQWSGNVSVLDPASLSAYRAGRFYAQIATPGNPDGLIRGQIVPPDAAAFDDQAPVVSLSSPGDPVTGTITLQADASDNQEVTIVRFLVNGNVVGTDNTPPYSIEWDTTSVANGQVTLTAEADDAAGNTGTSAGIITTVQNVVPVTLTQIQTQVFGPVCSGCHNGTGGSLPGVMNLSSSTNSYANLVSVMSLQQGALYRVEPGNPDNSYLIRKLEGTPGINGSRMPQGGPYLDQATVNQIRQWITDGAANN